MIKRKSSLLYCLITVFLISAAGSGLSQPETSGTVLIETGVTTDSLSSLSSEIESARREAEKLAAEDPDSEPAATAVDLLNQAAEQLQLYENYTSATKKNERTIREAPAALEMVKRDLAQGDTASSHAINLPTTATAELVEKRLNEAKAELAGVEKYLAEVTAEQERRSERMEAIPRELVEARQNLSQAELSVAAGPGTDEPRVANARLLLARAQAQAAKARMAALQSEEAGFDAREELLPLARQLLNQRVASMQAAVKRLTDKLAALRRTEASASARELKMAAQQTMTSHSLVQVVASENTSITAQWNLSAVVQKHDSAADQLLAVTEIEDRVSNGYKSLTQKFRSVGYSDSLGLLLQKMRKELPGLRSHRVALELRARTLAETNYEALQIQDMLTALSDPDAEAVKLATDAGLDLSTSAGQAVRLEIASLLQARREYFLKLREAYDKYFQTLVDLNAAQTELVQQTSAYLEFIDERILWLPSTQRMSLGGIEQAWQSFVSLAQPSLWLNYWGDFLKRGKDSPFLFGIGGLVLLVIIVSRRRWKLRMRSQLETASRNRLAAFLPAIRCLMDAALYVLPLPALMLAVGWPLANLYRISVETASIANGLIYGAGALFVLRLAQVIIQRRGIAEIFFAWPASALGKLRRVFSLIIWVYVPAVILIRMWDFIGTDAALEAARIVLIVLLLVTAIAVGWLLKPSTSVFKGLHIYRSSGIFYRLRYPVFFALTTMPAFLAIGAMMGYLYTATQLSQHIEISLWLGAAVLVLSETAFFWILVKRRRLAIDEARKRREAAAKAQEAESGGTTGSEPSVPAAEPTLDIAAISQQAGRLLRAVVLGFFIIGLWGVWAGVLPALGYLDSQALWDVTREASQVSEDGTVHAVTRQVPVTVADMLLVVLILIGVVAALRNIPGLLDISVYQKLAVQSGERYAFNTLIRYVIILVATVYVCYLLGLQWNQIQWLVAGISVGLGFGLQEIFANFVSGLILLFERPVRVGDFVEVGPIKGNITQIRIRATTVLDWDHFEHIIPNKEMITKSVANWTLSDLKRRLVIHVSVPYGCDYDKALEILLKVAHDNPYVLDDPGPSGGIEALGESSVVIVIFAHLPNADNYLAARHMLLAEFERQLSANGIKMPFPQLDIHLERVQKQPNA